MLYTMYLVMNERDLLGDTLIDKLELEGKILRSEDRIVVFVNIRG